jgi:hypothetical protein
MYSVFVDDNRSQDVADDGSSHCQNMINAPAEESHVCRKKPSLPQAAWVQKYTSLLNSVSLIPRDEVEMPGSRKITLENPSNCGPPKSFGSSKPVTKVVNCPQAGTAIMAVVARTSPSNDVRRIGYAPFARE